MAFLDCGLTSELNPVYALENTDKKAMFKNTRKKQNKTKTPKHQPNKIKRHFK